MKATLFRITVILILVAVVIYGLKWNKPAKVVTTTEYVYKTDTITKVEIDTNYITRYVDKVKTIKGQDSIIYVEVPGEHSIEAREYRTEIKSDSASAKLKITTSGELFDVSGVITYPKEIKTVKTYQNASGLFLSGQTDLNFQNFGLGLDYVYKNTILAGINANYNTIHNYSYIGFKVGIKIK